MPYLRSVYSQRALSQIPRLLGLQDRNPYSPTFGCFKRTYWLDKTVDFPDALAQFGVLSLALAYHYDFPGNIYKNQAKMREWIIAGMKYWAKIQHKDGSFDEFYPNERGWTGPTGFLLYSMLKSSMILDERKEFPEDFRDEFNSACKKAADYIIKWDEHGVLANHHAMGVLPVYYAFHVLGDETFRAGYEKKLSEFLKYHIVEEGWPAGRSPTCPPELQRRRKGVGWSLEYDGADIGYLSATVSFLGKVYKLNRDSRLKKIMEESVEFLSYFVYPNGFFAGSMGSRNTLHFYPHGCEILAPQFPLAGRVADAMLESLRDGKIVPAEIQSDRYFLYRIPEHLESYVDYGERSGSADLPYEREDFRAVFHKGRFFVEKKNDIYLVANAAKGGVVKWFGTAKRTLLTSDCGVIGETADGGTITSQWIDPEYSFEILSDGFAVSGSLCRVPADKLFTPLKFIIFRLFLLLFGWNTRMAYWIKGLIRKLLMLKSGKTSSVFKREVRIGDNGITISDTITANGIKFASLQIGDEFFVRYVPQSRYFQSQEFDSSGYKFSASEIARLNAYETITIERNVTI